MLCLVDLLGGRNFKFLYFKKITFANKMSGVKLKEEMVLQFRHSIVPKLKFRKPPLETFWKSKV